MKKSVLFAAWTALMLTACSHQEQKKETDMEFTDNVKVAFADSGRIDLNALQWTREPKGFEVKGDTIRITTAPRPTYGSALTITSRTTMHPYCR